MDHDYLLRLKQSHPTLRLLGADNAPLILGFVYRVFIEPNRRALPYGDAVSLLEDYLYALREVHGEGQYPRSARQYLEDWSGGQTPYLRKYYPELGDEPEFDLTPATEKAVEWIQGLEERQFVGTESRLLSVFALLREIVHHSEADPKQRIQELERQKVQIDTEIEKLRAGIMEPLDPTRIKERFFHVEETARKLLGDFRQVEYNFRALDREIRERIATSDKAKGELLDEIFQEHDVIWDSDQGKSFRAFWEFLMSPRRQEELERLLERLFALEAVRSLEPSDFLSHIQFYLLDAGEKVYRTNNLLVEQLRRYLDDQAWLENRRILELIRGIERRAVAIKDTTPPDTPAFAELDEFRPGIELVMSRNLFTPPSHPAIDDHPLAEVQVDIEVDALYRQTWIDEAELKARVRKALQTRSQITLGELSERFPIRKGLAEVIAYFNLASRADKALISDTEQEVLDLVASDGHARRVELPKVIFLRSS